MKTNNVELDSSERKLAYYNLNRKFGLILLFLLFVYAIIIISFRFSPFYFHYLIIFYALYSLISTLYFKKTKIAYNGIVGGNYAYIYWGFLHFFVYLFFAAYLLQLRYKYNSFYLLIVGLFFIIVIPFLIVLIKYKLTKGKKRYIPWWLLYRE